MNFSLALLDQTFLSITHTNHLGEWEVAAVLIIPPEPPTFPQIYGMLTENETRTSLKAPTYIRRALAHSIIAHVTHQRLKAILGDI